MSKDGMRGYIALAVIFVVFNVIAFAAPFPMTVDFWIAYVFGIIAIAYQVYVFKILLSGESDAKSKFYGFPIARVGIYYLITQLIVSILEMVLAAILPLWLPLIINVIVLALAIVGCIAVNAMRDEIVRQDTQLKKEVSNMRALQSMSAALVGQCTEEEVKKAVQNLADEFKYSDPVSSDQTKELEEELQRQMREIQKAIIDEDHSAVVTLCNRMKGSLAERNRICALDK